MERTFTIGTLDREHVRVTLKLDDANGRERLSITGETQHPSAHDISSGGQNTDAIRRVEHFRNGWTPELRDRLVRVWERWHLNDMRAGCEHQREGGAATVGDVCDVCGYRYGSAWLYEPLPDDVHAWVVDLIEHGPREGAAA